MRISNSLRTILLLIPPLFLVLPFAIAVFVLARTAQRTLVAQSAFGIYGSTAQYVITVYGPANAITTTNEYIDIPLNISYGVYFAILAVCVVSYIGAVIGICGVWELRTVEGTMRHQRRWCWFLLRSTLLKFMAVVGILAYACQAQGSDNAWKTYDDVGKGGTFTPETWVCQLDEFFPAQDWAGPACGMAKAARFMLIPLALASLLVLVVGWLLAKQRGGFRWLFGGKGVYGGFDNLYEMQTPAAGATAVPKPGPTVQSREINYS